MGNKALMAKIAPARAFYLKSLAEVYRPWDAETMKSALDDNACGKEQCSPNFRFCHSSGECIVYET